MFKIKVNSLCSILTIQSSNTKPDYSSARAISPFFSDLISELDINHDEQLSLGEIRAAFKDPQYANILQKLIVKHPSEWYGVSTSNFLSFLTSQPLGYENLYQHEKDRVAKLVWMQELNELAYSTPRCKLNFNPNVWHFYPLSLYVSRYKGPFTITDAESALEIIYKKYGYEMTSIIERMYRDETAHFESEQYKVCGTGGMEAFGKSPYYGWDSRIFKSNPEYTPVGTWCKKENKGLSEVGGNSQVLDKEKTFIVFPSVLGAMLYKVKYIDRHNGNWAAWHSSKKTAQETYKKYLTKIKPRFADKFKKQGLK